MKVPHQKSALKLIGLAVSLAFGPQVFGATYYWGNPNMGNWNEPTNWIGGLLPDGGEVRITNGGIALIEAGQDVAAGYITLGDVVGTAGALKLNGGNLSGTLIEIRLGGNKRDGGGAATFEQSGGNFSLIGYNGDASFHVGYGPTAIGTYNMLGGSFNFHGSGLIVVGNGGLGTVNQSGGSIFHHGIEGKVQFGADDGVNGNFPRTNGSGTYNLSGGTLAVANIAFGAYFPTEGVGTNTFNLSGTGILKVGTVGSFRFSSKSSNFFNFTGGTLMASNTRITLHNRGGILDPAGLNFAHFEHTDADHIVGVDTYTLTFANSSSYVQEPAGTLVIDIGSDSQDRIDIETGGSAEIAGTIVVRFTNSSPPLGAAFDVVFADSIICTAQVLGQTSQGYRLFPSVITASGGRQVLRLTVAPPAPRLSQSRAVGENNHEFSFTNLPGIAFTALTSTNLGLPVTNWAILGPVTESLPGSFQFYDLRATNEGQRFYRVRYP